MNFHVTWLRSRIHCWLRRTDARRKHWYHSPNL